MGKVKIDEIRGYEIGDDVVCSECVTEEEEEQAKEDQILTDDDLAKDDSIFFCNRCKERL